MARQVTWKHVIKIFKEEQLQGDMVILQNRKIIRGLIESIAVNEKDKLIIFKMKWLAYRNRGISRWISLWDNAVRVDISIVPEKTKSKDITFHLRLLDIEARVIIYASKEDRLDEKLLPK